ncbi:MAG: peptidoglycan DD-metalloendopeptidase family protein [Hyphomicrobiales bacterium]|nr:peptidoglycan DD-metalloendopeptidase family protein [Hyphomicrobiales bacterium]
MRYRVLGTIERRLALSAAVVLIGGLASGCSSDTARFSDDLFTGSTYRGDTVVRPPASQPFPGDTMASNRNVDPMPTGTVHGRSGSMGSVSGSTLAPVTGSSLPPVASSGAIGSHRVASYEPPASRNPPRAVEESRHNDAAPVRTHGSGVGSWSRAGGTEITANAGDTIYSLSRRFGVPAKEIVAANGMSSAKALQSGQKIIIPTYHQGGASRTADARPVRDEPKTSRAPEQVAVLPQQPRVKEDRNTKTPSSASTRTGASTGKYTVESGDSLYAVARKTGVSVADIKEANRLNSSMLRIGQVLTIPSADSGTKVARAEPAKVDPVETGTTPPAHKASAASSEGAKPAGYTPPHKADKQIAAVEQDSKATAPDATGIGKMRWPVRGRVISAFGGGGADGDGIDIAVPEGTPVKAAENGVVIYAGNGLKEFGNTVLVRHEDGLVTVYGHAKSLEVSRGDKVRRGQEIAQSGMSGKADSPRLHFEVRKNSAPVDPRKYLE